jgi:outer membrane protein insertion porin family
MGNVFTDAEDAWVSALRIHQPDRDTCKGAVANVNDPGSYIPQGNPDSTGVHGTCNFNYFSHAPGIGLRYHTPVGPIRFDFSYNLNPPIYPININYSIPTPSPNPLGLPGYEQSPHLGQAPHFNFVFSLGQAF